ncbi:MAG: polyprenol monophosphomannose synthase [Patescibacteria group bacterium]
MKLSIVIPTYNEEGNIKTLLETTDEILQSIPVTFELIVVDDNSKDKTRPIVRELQKINPRITLIERDNERGLATALVRGYNASQGQYLGAMDADLAHNPEYLPKMIGLLDSNKADFIIGSRYAKGATFTGKPLLNKIASLSGQFLIKIILGLNVKDTSNNYRIFKKEIWEKIKNQLHPDGNIMLTEIVYRAYKNNFRIAEIPISYIERRAGKSKLSVFKETVKFFKNIWKIKFN